MIYIPSILDTKTPNKINTDNSSNKKPLGNVQEENLPLETEKKHCSDHSPPRCPTEDAESHSIKFKKILKKKKISTSSSTEEKDKWVETNNVETETDNR